MMISESWSDGHTTPQFPTNITHHTYTQKGNSGPLQYIKEKDNERQCVILDWILDLKKINYKEYFETVEEFWTGIAS